MCLRTTICIVIISFFPLEQPISKSCSSSDSDAEPIIVCHKNKHKEIAKHYLDYMQKRLKQMHSGKQQCTVIINSVIKYCEYFTEIIISVHTYFLDFFCWFFLRNVVCAKRYSLKRTIMTRLITCIFFIF